MTDTGTHLNRTELGERNRIECDWCEEEIEGDGSDSGEAENKRTVHWGQWDAEAQAFDGPPYQEHYCMECWGREFEREAAAYYEYDDGERVLDILAASDGRLVADLGNLFIGTRPFVRVVDGDLQGIKPVFEEHPDEEKTVRTTLKRFEGGREDLLRVMRAERTSRPSPAVVLLKPIDETPFTEWDDGDENVLPENQVTLGEVSD